MGLSGSLIPSLAKESKKAIDYWREYRGQTVRVEYTELEYPEGDPQNGLKTTHGVIGEVSKVMALPPGFLLEDAEYFVNPERQNIESVPEGGSYRDEKGELFVSFDSIERMSFEDE